MTCSISSCSTAASRARFVPALGLSSRSFYRSVGCKFQTLRSTVCCGVREEVELSTGSVSAMADDDIQSESSQKMLAPFTAAYQFTDGNPLVIDKSEGVYVQDSEGKKYLDALAGLWSTALGGNEERLVEAATKQMRKLPFYHSFWNRTTAPALQLSAELTSLFTANKMAQAFFTNSGSEANDTQVKLVWYYFNAIGLPDKKKFIAREKAYHGSTVMAASLTGLTPMHRSFDLPLGPVLRTDCPHFYRNGRPGETEEEYSTRLAENLDKLIIEEGPDTVAAFIAEPLMGAGGVILPPKGYWSKIQKVLTKHKVLLVADEVVCGFGRTGEMFGSDYYQIRPHLVTLAKALSSAYIPIGAVLICEEIAEKVASHSNSMGSFAHGFTYSGHPVACAVALEVLAIYRERSILEHVRKVAPSFQDGLRKVCEGSAIVGEVRGVGLIAGVEFVKNLESKESFPADWKVGAFFGKQAEAEGALVRTVGDTIAMSPPLVISEEEIESLLSIFKVALKRTEEYVKEKEAA